MKNRDVDTRLRAADPLGGLLPAPRALETPAGRLTELEFGRRVLRGHLAAWLAAAGAVAALAFGIVAALHDHADSPPTRAAATGGPISASGGPPVATACAGVAPVGSGTVQAVPMTVTTPTTPILPAGTEPALPSSTTAAAATPPSSTTAAAATPPSSTTAAVAAATLTTTTVTHPPAGPAATVTRIDTAEAVPPAAPCITATPAPPDIPTIGGAGNFEAFCLKNPGACAPETRTPIQLQATDAGVAAGAGGTATLITFGGHPDPPTVIELAPTGMPDDVIVRLAGPARSVDLGHLPPPRRGAVDRVDAIVGQALDKTGHTAVRLQLVDADGHVLLQGTL